MKSIVAKIAFILALATIPAKAEEITASISQVETSCPGRDLFLELSKTNPEKAKKILADSRKVKNSGPLFWKITPPNGAAPSYLLGTIHVTDDKINALSEDMKKKIRSAKTLALELKELEGRFAVSYHMLQQKKFIEMPDGRLLWDVVPDKLEAKISAHPNLKWIQRADLGKLRPIMVSMQIGRSECEQERLSKKFVLDQSLVFQAQLSYVPIVGLETVAEQAAAFTALPVEDEVDMLLESLNPKIAHEDELATMIGLYQRRQIAAATPLFMEIEKDPVLQQHYLKLEAALLGQRNVNMADRSVPLIEKGNAFIAVGAAHLAAENGVVELLRKKGFKLEPEKY